MFITCTISHFIPFLVRHYHYLWFSEVIMATTIVMFLVSSFRHVCRILLMKNIFLGKINKKSTHVYVHILLHILINICILVHMYTHINKQIYITILIY